MRFYLRNTGFAPTSPFAFRQAGEGQLAAGDTAAALASFQHALMLNPKDAQLQRMVDSLKAKPQP